MQKSSQDESRRDTLPSPAIVHDDDKPPDEAPKRLSLGSFEIIRVG